MGGLVKLGTVLFSGEMPALHPCTFRFGTEPCASSLELVSCADFRREALYYQALGHYILADYANSRHVIMVLLTDHPGDRQAIDLRRLIEEQTAKGMPVPPRCCAGQRQCVIVCGSHFF